MRSLSRAIGVAGFTFRAALHSRRALVTALLFAMIGAGVMYLTVSLLSTLEVQLLKMLSLPIADVSGAVTMTLWKSDQFVAMASHLVGNPLVFAEIRSQHPIVLAFAGFVFASVPLLTLMVSAPTAAGDIRSGSARYVLLRVSRTEWTFGVFLGEALALFVAMQALAVSAWLVATFRMPGMSGAELLPSLCLWSVRAWAYAFAWLGVFIGASLVAKTPGKATALAMLLMVTLTALVFVVSHHAPWLDYLCPSCYRWMLWRRSPGALFQGLVGVCAVSTFWLGLGAAVFARRDV